MCGTYPRYHPTFPAYRRRKRNESCIRRDAIAIRKCIKGQTELTERHIQSCMLYLTLHYQAITAEASSGAKADPHINCKVKTPLRSFKP